MFSVIVAHRNGQFDDAYICADLVAPWHKETLKAKGYLVTVRKGFNTEAAAQKVIDEDYPQHKCACSGARYSPAPVDEG